MYVKGRLFRNKKYLEFVANFDSSTAYEDNENLAQAPFIQEEIVAHHVRMGGNGGTGIKPSDYRCVPLSNDEHGDLHSKGERTFWEYYGVDPDEVQIYLMLKYIKDRKAVLDALEDLIEVERD